jgi:hypothetical protein
MRPIHPRLLVPVLLLSFLAVHSSAQEEEQAIEFNWRDSLLTWIKLSEDFEYSERRMESYLQIDRPETWNAVRNNEFKLAAAIKTATERLKKEVANHRTDRPIVLRGSLTYGKYDAAREGFPINELTPTHYWYTNSRRYASQLPNQFSIYFRNTKEFEILKMPVEIAEKFLERQLALQRGYNSRTIYFEAKIQIKELREKNENQFNADILSITYFENPQRNRIIGTATMGKKKEKVRETKD